MTGLYVLASAGLVCLSFLVGRRFPVTPRGDGLAGTAVHGREQRDDGATEVTVPRLTGPVAASSAGVSADAFADLDRRVTALERSARRRTRPQQRVDRLPVLAPTADEPPVDKPAAVSHYEALADQVARERRLAEVEPRGRVMRFPSRPLAVAREPQDR